MTTSNRISDICNRMEKNFPGFIEKYNEQLIMASNAFLGGVGEKQRISILDSMITGVNLAMDKVIADKLKLA